MADKKLSSVSAVSDMNYVYAETSSGETVKISKADLASVVAGLIASNSAFMSNKSISQSNANDITTSGFYMNIGQITSNLPSTEFGTLICFSFGTSLQVVQMYIPAQYDANKFFLRQYSAGSWKTWSTII